MASALWKSLLLPPTVIGLNKAVLRGRAFLARVPSLDLGKQSLCRHLKLLFAAWAARNPEVKLGLRQLLHLQWVGKAGGERGRK